jgi:carbonic anhydrase/acetyltransferase-like protein (isoleucine patch superfamily)
MSIILKYRGVSPKIAKSSFIAQNAVISGNVDIGENVGIWYCCIIRGDVSHIKIGNNTNIQDGTTIHVTRPNHIANKTGNDGGPVTIGNNVTVGHNCIIHASILEDNTFIGMGSVVMDLATVEKNSMLAAGSVLTPGKVVKSGELWGGVPAKKLRMLTQQEIDYIQTSANNYSELAKEYMSAEVCK